MKCVPRDRVVKTLRGYGLRRLGWGQGGHACFGNAAGQTVQASIRETDIPMAYLYSLAGELDKKGIAKKEEFWKAVRGR